MEPAEHLMQRIQYLDEHGNSILDFNHESSSPLREARASFASMVFQPVDDGKLAPVFWQYPLEYDKITSESRRMLVSVDAQVRCGAGMGMMETSSGKHP